MTLSLVRADVQAGFDQFARGEARTYDKTSGRQLAERIKSRGRAARAKKQETLAAVSAVVLDSSM